MYEPSPTKRTGERERAELKTKNKNGSSLFFLSFSSFPNLPARLSDLFPMNGVCVHAVFSWVLFVCLLPLRNFLLSIHLYRELIGFEKKKRKELFSLLPVVFDEKLDTCSTILFNLFLPFAESTSPCRSSRRTVTRRMFSSIWKSKSRNSWEVSSALFFLYSNYSY